MPRRRTLNRKRPLTNGNLGLRFERASGDSDNLKWYNLANLTGVDIDFAIMHMSAGDWPNFDGVGDFCGTGQGVDSGGAALFKYPNFATNPLNGYEDLGGGIFITNRCFEVAVRPTAVNAARRYGGYHTIVSPRSDGGDMGLNVQNFSQALQIASGVNIEANKWTHLAVNYTITNGPTNGHAVLYKDGSEILSTKNQTRTITGITAANPGVVTCTGHNLSNGMFVTFSGLAAGPYGTMLNGQTLPVTKIDANSFSFGDTSMLGSNYTGTGTITFDYPPRRNLSDVTQRAYWIGTSASINNFASGELDTFRAWTRHLTTDEIARNAGIVIGRNG